MFEKVGPSKAANLNRHRILEHLRLRQKLTKTILVCNSDAGGTIVTPLGDRLAMLRDPWGLSIQLCNRKNQITAGV
jgi:hypothetical protein